MKQIKHTLITQEEPMDQETFSQKLPHLFEWANKMGREGKFVTHLDVQPNTVTCVEYITDDDYTMLMRSGKITETTETTESTETETTEETTESVNA